MSDTESSHGIAKPSETYHQAKMRLDKELKALTKTAKGKAGKEQIKSKENDIEKELAQIKSQWDIYNRAENGEDVSSYITQTSSDNTTITDGTSPDDLTNALQNMLINPIVQREVVLTKQQRKKLEREEKEKELDQQYKESLKGVPDYKQIENNKISYQLTNITFKLNKSLCGITYPACINEIKGDGHCLFRSIQSQLLYWATQANITPYDAWIQYIPTHIIDVAYNLFPNSIPSTDKHNIEITVELLRALSAAYIKINSDDFVPFLIDDEAFQNGGIDSYVQAIGGMNSFIWGGEAEIKALSDIFTVPINILSQDGIMCMGEQYITKENSLGPLYIAFHKNWVSTGAHYNAIVPQIITPKA